MAQLPSIIRRADDTGVPLLLIRLFLGGLFIYMGVNKIADPVAFMKQVRLYEMLPESPAYFLNGTAVILPWLEVVCGVALIAGIAIRGSGVAIAGMLAVFTPAIFLRAMAIHNTEGTPFFEIAFDCGCGGGPVIIWQKLLSNSGLLLLAILAVLSRSRRFTLAGRLARAKNAGRTCPQCGSPIADASEGVCENCRVATGATARTPDPAT